MLCYVLDAVRIKYFYRRHCMCRRKENKISIIHRSFAAPEANGNKCTVAHTRTHTFRIGCAGTHILHISECMQERTNGRTRMRHRIGSAECDLLFSPHKYMRRLNCANNEMESSSVCCNRCSPVMPVSRTNSRKCIRHRHISHVELCYRQFPFIEFKFGRRDPCTHSTHH